MAEPAEPEAWCDADGGFWVFGYGSLIWKPDMPSDAERWGSVRGWVRRFWQGSWDHRGTREAPGRVVTMLRAADALALDPAGEAALGTAPDAELWGRCFHVPAAAADEQLAKLDFREKAGYERDALEVRCEDGSRITALVFHADASNVDFAGAAPIEEVARVIRERVGPSGPNAEYMLNLAAALRERGLGEAEEPHIFQLERLTGRGAEPAGPPGETEETEEEPAAA